MSERNLLLIDDHALFRAGLRLIIDSKLTANIFEMERISDVDNITGNIDVILLDINLPGINGIDGMCILKQRWPHARIMLLSAQSHHKDINRGLALGADCFLNKNTNPALICKTVDSLFSKCLNNETDAYEAHSHRISSYDSQLFASMTTQAKVILSTRMLEVLTLVAEGHSNKYIANKLELSEHTIRNHVASLMKHFDVNNRTKIIIAAQNAGYLQ